MAVERVVVKYGTSTGKTMMRAEVVGAHRLRDLRLSGDVKLRTVMLTRQMVQAQWQVEVVIGKNVRVQALLLKEIDRLMMKERRQDRWVYIPLSALSCGSHNFILLDCSIS